jgi:hypothetical protein
MGLGYHEQHERWIVDAWEWYESSRFNVSTPVIPKDDAIRQIPQRAAFVRTQANPTP